MRRPLPNLPRKPILSSCHKIAQPEELDNWAVWLRTCFKKHFHCSSRREEAQKFGSFIRDQTLLTSAATILKHALKRRSGGRSSRRASRFPLHPFGPPW